MTKKHHSYKREVVNQVINLFWTVLCFTPVFWFWYREGINNRCFYLFLIIALTAGILPKKILDMLIFSPRKKFYERLGVKHIRKFVQNGDTVNAMANTTGYGIIKGRAGVQRYLKTIEMYERYHWACFFFFLLTGVYCFVYGYFESGLMITLANILYNISSILLQQYNKIRIKKITGA